MFLVEWNQCICQVFQFEVNICNLEAPFLGEWGGCALNFFLVGMCHVDFQK